MLHAVDFSSSAEVLIATCPNANALLLTVLDLVVNSRGLASPAYCRIFNNEYRH